MLQKNLFHVFYESCKFAVAVGCMLAAFCDMAWAQQVFQVATDQATDIFNAAFPILEGIGVLGALGVGAMAMTGRMPWGWAFALLGALLLIKLAAPLKDWVQNTAQTPAGVPTGASDLQAVAATVKNAAKTDLGDDTRIIIYAFSGIAITALAILSMFGRFQWKWLFAICAGLLIVEWGTSIVSEFAGNGTISQSSIGDSLIDTEQLADRTARQGQYIIYALGGIAVLGLSAMAMMGRFSWNWFFAMAGGLMLIAGINLGIQYITGQQNPFDAQFTAGN